ncbi:MAG: DNA polymerase III subunit beta [Candidatus Omnitrophica bacterium]|nr:DNA polymerase III subunit beta [Candidatus Omnitrophota bacterium]
MHFETTKADFLKILQIAQSAISAKNALPILSNLLLEADESTIKVAATDLDIGISSKIEAKIKEVGSITIPAKKLIDIVKELPNENTMSVLLKKNNTVYIDCGKAHFKIVGLPKEEFPQTPEFKDKDAITISCGLLKKMLSLTNFAVSKDEARYILNGVLFIIKNQKLKLVATDGRRLAVTEEGFEGKSSLDKRVIIPSKTTNELLKILDDEGDLKISFGENQVFFDLGKTRIISRLVEGEFPSYEQVIPKERQEKIKVNRNELLAATKRASLFTNQDSLAVKMDIAKNKITVSKSAPYMGEVKEEVSITYGGRNVSVGFNPAYIIDALKNLSQEEIELEIEDADKPGVLRIGGEYIYVVLPMQLGQ